MKILKSGWEIGLPVLALAAVPFGRTVEIPVLIMAMVGLSDLVSNRLAIRANAKIRIFTLFFLLFWLPAMLSLLDAVNLQRSIESGVGMLRFYLVGVFIISRVDKATPRQRMGILLTSVVVFWAIDGWIQVLFGVDVFGLVAASSDRVSGVFGENARLGLMIVPFLGVAVFSTSKQLGTNWALAVGLLLSATILVSGDRAAWGSLVVTLFLLLGLLGRKLLVIPPGRASIIFVALAATMFSVINVPQFDQRISSVAIDGNYDSTNKVLSFRLPIWTTAYHMFLDNPVNGVGVRSFRYAYPDYASKDDPFIDFSLPREERIGQTHAHQVVLEIAADTGVPGVLGYLIALWIIWVKWLPLARASVEPVALGYLVSLLVVLFPFNTHQSIYSSHWGQLVWMLVALAVSSIANNTESRVDWIQKSAETGS